MNILITGHRGFVGQNLVKALETEHTLSFYEWGDDFPILHGIDWVIHLGAISDTTETDVEKVMRQNYDFSIHLLDMCQSWLINFQYASSASIYGKAVNFNENAPKNPLSPYAWSKYLFDRWVEKRKFVGIRVQGFRYFNVYGPHEDHKGNQASPYHKFEKQARETGVITLFEGSENYYRDFVPVDTVVNVHKKFLKVNESGIWNVGSGEARSFQEVAEEIAKKYSAEIKYIPMPDNVKNQYQAYTKADLTKLRKHIDI